MKRSVLVSAAVFFVISLSFIKTSVAQDQHSVGVPQEVKTQASNSIFLELGGNGLLYTVNYDRLLAQDYGFRVGIGYLGVSSSSPDNGNGSTSASASFLIIPATFNYFFASHTDGKVGSSKFEVGAGIVLVDLSASVSGGGVGSAFSGSGVGGTATIGYRYQPSDGGVLFRVGFTPFFTSKGFLPWAGISVGFTF
jgi:hypothetical protein